MPGAPTADWVDIYNRLYRERIIFLGQEIDDELANQIIGVLLVSFFIVFARVLCCEKYTKKYFFCYKKVYVFFFFFSHH